MSEATNRRKVAFVSGLARGQGRTHALMLARNGYDIVGIDVPSDMATVPYPMASGGDLSQTVKELEAAGAKVVVTEGDTRSPEDVQRAFDAGAAELDGMDVALANAGICAYTGVLDMTFDQWQTMIDVNLTGTFNVAQAAARHMVKAGAGGAIILTSSSMATKAHANLAHYVAAKFGVEGLMRSMAIELAPHKIRVNTVQPTAVNTALVQNQATYDLFCPDIENPTAADALPRLAGLGLIGPELMEPERITDAIEWLVSDKARMVTGMSLKIDAGSTLK